MKQKLKSFLGYLLLVWQNRRPAKKTAFIGLGLLLLVLLIFGSVWMMQLTQSKDDGAQTASNASLGTSGTEQTLDQAKYPADGQSGMRAVQQPSRQTYGRGPASAGTCPDGPLFNHIPWRCPIFGPSGRWDSLHIPSTFWAPSIPTFLSICRASPKKA